MTKTSKRPRDLNQWAKRMVDIATMDDAERKGLEEEKKSRGLESHRSLKRRGGKGPPLIEERFSLHAFLPNRMDH
jgi:hypothetical protein